MDGLGREGFTDGVDGEYGDERTTRSQAMKESREPDTKRIMKSRMKEFELDNATSRLEEFLVLYPSI